MVTFIVHLLFCLQYEALITAIRVKKSVDVYLAVLEGVPCPLKINLQCSANKKVWEPLP